MEASHFQKKKGGKMALTALSASIE